MALTIRKEFILKHPYVFMFSTLVTLTIVISSCAYKKHTDEHNRTCLFSEVKLQCATLSNLFQEEINQTYAEENKRNELFSTEYLNNHVPVKQFLLDRMTDLRPAAKLVGSTRCFKKDDQIQSMWKVLFGANNKGDHHSHGFLRNGVILQNGRLIVPLKGSYWIYSSFNHRVQCSLPERQVRADEAPVVRHVMYRFNIRLGHDQEMASINHEHINCKCSAFVDFKTEISMLVELLAGDEISVKLNDCSLLIHSDANYFGVRLI